MLLLPRVLPALLAALAILVLPASASAADYTVDIAIDQVDDDPGDGDCETAAETCTLRAALTEVNLSTDVANSIGFDSTVFNGQEEDTIFLASTLPTIFEPVTIDAGSTCTTAGISGGPCAGVTGVAGEPVFAVEADDSAISGLSITAGSIGIGVFGESVGFTATGNWIGVPMSGTNAGNASAGIFVGPGSDEAQIGGSDPADGNLIAHNEVGLDIEGASGATVQGNWFGQMQSGIDPERADANIEITDYKPLVGDESKAEDSEIGAAVDAASQASADCDGGCNVIAGAGDDAIDLVGDGAIASEAPASGPTTIHGNYVGLDGTGTVVLENGESGVDAGAAGEVTIGGAEPGEANLFAGGVTGVSSRGGSSLKVIGNAFGVDGEGATVTPPSDVGIFSSQSALVFPEEIAQIDRNTLRMDEESTGIERENYGAAIRENTVEGGGIGIRLKGSISGGSVIERNEIVEPEDAGILVNNQENKIWDNEVTGSGEMGIEVDPGAEIDVSGNVIGGDSPQSENRIFDSGAYAILIRGVEESRNEVRRNRGSGNSDEGFIVLRPYDPSGGDPNGVNSPAIATAGKTAASGSAEPGAVVRVFWKASSGAGELAGFLGQAVTNGSGQWKANYAAQPEGTMVVATQTLDGGTSSLSEMATTPPDPPPTCADTPAMCVKPPVSGPPAPALDTTKPKVTIKQAPKAKSASTVAKFKFVSDEAGSTFQCKLDRKAFANCRSPRTYKKLKPGKHVFKVKATDAAGNVSAVVARRFTVLS
jgi:Right handed beta helix region